MSVHQNVGDQSQVFNLSSSLFLLQLATGVNLSFNDSFTDMKLDCRPDFVSLVWANSRPQAEPSVIRLGNCPPTSVSAEEAVFNVGLNDCHFRRMVSLPSVASGHYLISGCATGNYLFITSFTGNWGSASVHQ